VHKFHKRKLLWPSDASMNRNNGIDGGISWLKSVQIDRGFGAFALNAPAIGGNLGPPD
jgi:hypothetical protein